VEREKVEWWLTVGKRQTSNQEALIEQRQGTGEQTRNKW
jgi:hypothetical protein